MALFGKSNKPEKLRKVQQDVRPVMGKSVYCSECKDHKTFTRCWLRIQQVRQCQCCGMVFEAPGRLYEQQVPSCPKCGEFLEQPGFEYGLCDGCGTKFEVMSGTKPSLIPSRQRRVEMEKLGKVRIPKK